MYNNIKKSKNNIKNNEETKNININLKKDLTCVKDIKPCNNSKTDNNESIFMSENDEQVVSIEEADIEGFKRKCIFVKYGEIIEDNANMITCVSNGSFFGWCNFLLKDLDLNLSFYLISSISYAKRFTVYAKGVVCDFLIDFRSVECFKVETKKKTLENALNSENVNDNISSLYDKNVIRQNDIIVDYNNDDSNYNKINECNKKINKDAKIINEGVITDSIAIAFNLSSNCINTENIINNKNFEENFLNINDKQNQDIIKKELIYKTFNNENKHDDDEFLDVYVIQNEAVNIENFIDCIYKAIAENKAVIIPLEITELFLEVIFHLFYMLSKSKRNYKIAICSNIYTKLSTIVNIQSEWLNEIFASSVNAGTEPFSFKQYPHLYTYESIFDITEIPNILFMSINEYKFINVNQIFDNQCVISFNKSLLKSNFNYNILIEETFESINEKYEMSTILSSSGNTEKLVDGFNYCFEGENGDASLKFKNTNQIQTYLKKGKITFYIEGTMKNKDGIYEISLGESYVKKLFATKRFFRIGNDYFFNSENVKITLENDVVHINKIIN
ncbi:hypothetical protein COBT_002422 [Conglomerata obtusa]